MARPVPLVALLAVAVCLLGPGLASAASITPTTLWTSLPLLPSRVHYESVSLTQLLQEVFGGQGAASRQGDGALEGVADARQLAGAHSAVVVVSSGEGARSEAVAAQLRALSAGAKSYLQLPNAFHLGHSHPVFASLRPKGAAPALRVLGDCAGVGLGGAPATPQALRQQLAAMLEEGAGAEQGAPPTLLVVCAPEGATQEAELLGEVAAALAAAPGDHLLVHTAWGGAAGAHGRRRRLLAEEEGGVAQAPTYYASSAAERTNNYTYCDPICQTQTKYFEGLIAFVVLMTALTSIWCCMHAINTPTRFSQPEGQRQHND